MVTAKSVFSEREVLKGFKLHFKHKNRFMRFAPFMGGFLILICLHQITFNQVPPSQLFVVLVFGITFLLLPIIIMWSVRRGVRKLPTLNNEAFWQLDENGIAAKGEGFEFSQSWANMREALLSNTGLLIYPQGAVFHWIPFSSFEKEEDFEKARALIRANIKNCKTI